MPSNFTTCLPLLVLPSSPTDAKDGGVPMRHGWQSIGPGAVGLDSSRLVLRKKSS
jgi:hypothetical protein